MRALGLMLVVLSAASLTAAGCGFCGCERLWESTRSAKVKAINELNDDQRDNLTKLGFGEGGEGIVWYYDGALIGAGSEGNVLTNRRIATFSDKTVFSATFDDIASASYEKGGTSERIRVERKNGEFIALQFGLTSDSKRMYDSLCAKIPGRCSSDGSSTAPLPAPTAPIEPMPTAPVEPAPTAPQEPTPTP